MHAQSLSCVWLFTTIWTEACQGPLSMGFSRQEYWSGLPFPPSGYLPEPGFHHKSPATQADSLPQSTFLMLLNFLVKKKIFIVCFCLSYYAKFSFSHFRAIWGGNTGVQPAIFNRKSNYKLLKISVLFLCICQGSEPVNSQ